MKTATRCREYREGKVSRRRTYKCRGCGVKFQVDSLASLPEEQRICPICREGDNLKGKVILKCAVCGHEGEDVHEYPVYNNGRNQTQYQCDSYESCMERKYSQEGKPWMVKEGAK